MYKQLPAQPKVLGRGNTSYFFKAFRDAGEQGAQSVMTQLAMKINPDVTGNQIKAAMENVDVRRASYGNGPAGVAVENSRVRLYVPKHLGPSAWQKFRHIAGLAVDAVMGLSSALIVTIAANNMYTTIQGVVAVAGTIAVAAYGVIKIGKNIVSAWKQEKAAKNNQLGAAIEEAITSALSQNTAKQ